MNCQNCSNPLTPGAKFCGNCGAIIQADPFARSPQPVAATVGAIAPTHVDSAPRATVVSPEVPSAASQSENGRVEPVSVKGPAVAGMVLGAVYLLGSAAAYVEGFQDFSGAIFTALASIDAFLGLLIFVPGVLLLTAIKISPSALLKTEYIAAVVVVTLSAISFRPAGLLFVIPALLAKQAHSRLQAAE